MKRDIAILNLQTDQLVVVLTEQVNSLRSKNLAYENEVIEALAKNSSYEGDITKLKREITSLNE
jgi:hypothetical protein